MNGRRKSRSIGICAFRGRTDALVGDEVKSAAVSSIPARGSFQLFVGDFVGEGLFISPMFLSVVIHGIGPFAKKMIRVATTQPLTAVTGDSVSGGALDVARAADVLCISIAQAANPSHARYCWNVVKPQLVPT